jgi:hypothetical protein
MAGSSIPGAVGSDTNRPQIDAGTSARIACPLPGCVGTGPTEIRAASVAAAVEAPPASDPAIDGLDLAAMARAAAYALKKAHPAVAFTSGRRSKEEQARAMAGNVVQNRKWIEQTYASSTLRTKCQEWVDANTDKKTAAQIAEGLVSVFDTFADADLGKFSKHLSGAAFDVQPVDKDADEVKKTIRGLPGLSKFLDQEGGLVRWHAEF